jgi:hypothetical protein
MEQQFCGDVDQDREWRGTICYRENLVAIGYLRVRLCMLGGQKK